MNSRKKSILIALCIGDGYITHQRLLRKGRYYTYNYLEVSHGQNQKDYIKWKADLCKSITGKSCRVRFKKYKERKSPTGIIAPSIGYTFTCSAPYFKVLRKWLYPNNQKVLAAKYLSYLDERGLAIWYCDDGCTYISKKNRTDFTTEISTHISKENAEELIKMFQEKWNINFHLHKKAENQYNIRAYSSEALKFIKLIEPFVPNCMDYKIRVPEFYFQECTASHINRMKIYSEQ